MFFGHGPCLILGSVTLLMPLAGIKGSVRLLSKVELFPRRNSAVFLASDCLSKVDFFLRRNITVLLLGDPVVL